MADSSPLQQVSPRQHTTGPTPESEYPHETHDISTLSHYFLEITAFTPANSMYTALEMRDNLNGKTVNECYADVTAKFNAAKELDDGRKDYDIHNPDRVGILIEYDGMFYTLLEPFSAVTITDDVRGSRYGWLERHEIDMHLLCEWESIPKQRIGTKFIAAATIPEETDGGWWHVHSENITALRLAIGDEAELAQGDRDIAFADLSEKDFLVACEELFKDAVMKAESAWATSEEGDELESAEADFWVERDW